MKFKGTLGTQFSGSLAGITASHNRGGAYLRQRAIPVDPSSSFQNARRNVFRTLVQRYTTVLSEAQREDWRLWALNTPFLDVLGDSRPITGQQAYVGANTLRDQAGLAFLNAAPVIFNRGAMGSLELGAVSAASDDYELTFDNTQSWATAVGGALLLFQGRPQNASVLYYNGPWRFTEAVLGAVVPPTSPFTAGPQPFPLALGQRLFVRAVAITADGRWTSPTVVSSIVGA